MSVCSRRAGAAGADERRGEEGGGPPPGVDWRGRGGRGDAGATKRKGDLRA